jgi:hypothetical protein
VIEKKLIRSKTTQKKRKPSETKGKQNVDIQRQKTAFEPQKFS